MSMVNYFVDERVARRYAASRPAFHAGVVERIRTFTALNLPVATALDVACGTGQSTLPLTELAQRVYGVDVSAAMLAAATADDRVTYVVGSAEALPFATASIDLITVALAFHWFNRDLFLAEVRRILRPGGWLVIYNNSFFGRMDESSAFETWFRDQYLRRFPTPPRHNAPLTRHDASAYNMRLRGEEVFTNTVVLESRHLVEYLTTQSNVIGPVESGRETLDAVVHWLNDQIIPLVPHQGGTFHFGGPISFLQRDT